MAYHLGGRSYMVYSARWGSRYATILFKYLSQTLKTLWILLRDRPRVVLVMAPPVVACVPVWLYCLIFGAQFSIDAHTGAFLDPRWRRVQFLQRFFSRRAVTTIVTNDYLKDVAENWRARVTIVTDVPVEFPDPEPVSLDGDFNVAVVASFCDDEPVAEIIRAAASVPDVDFYMTGNYERLSPELRADKPENVHFTGFLSRERYVGLLQAAQAVMALTTRDHTMQRAAYEAIYLGRPVITSDFEILRRAFQRGAVHVQAEAESIAEGVRRMRAELPRYWDGAGQLRAQKLDRWQDVAERLRTRLRLPGAEPGPVHPAPENAY